MATMKTTTPTAAQRAALADVLDLGAAAFARAAAHVRRGQWAKALRESTRARGIAGGTCLAISPHAAVARRAARKRRVAQQANDPMR